MEEQRTPMWCDVCRQADVHPRHHVASNGEVISRHMDCCRDSGCPSGHCATILADSGEKRGLELLAWIQERM